jgi:SPP1 gp7 family putative phage head morphogenesis protein
MPNYVDLSKKGTDSIEKAIKGTQKELANSYVQAAKDVNQEIAELYAKYSVEGTLSYSEVQKYNRLTNLEKSITDIVKKLKNQTQRTTGKAMEYAYKESYYLNMYLAEMQVQAGIGFSAPNEKMVEAAVMLPQSGLTYIQTITKNFTASLVKLKQTTTNGIIRGDSYSTMSKRVRDIFGGNAYNAERAIRTETHRVMVQGSIDSYDQAEELGVKSRRMWVSTLDDRTRPVKKQIADHRIMDGKYADKNGYFTLSNGAKTKGPGLSGYADQDINCRCRVIAVVVGYEPDVRREKGGKVIPFMTYEEWKELRKVA